MLTYPKDGAEFGTKKASFSGSLQGGQPAEDKLVILHEVKETLLLFGGGFHFLLFNCTPPLPLQTPILSVFLKLLLVFLFYCIIFMCSVYVPVLLPSCPVLLREKKKISTVEKTDTNEQTNKQIKVNKKNTGGKTPHTKRPLPLVFHLFS